MVEHDLAKVGVAGSSLVFRSKDSKPYGLEFFLQYILTTSPGGGTGRRAGLKILFPATEVRVRFPSGARKSRTEKESDERLSPFFYAHMPGSRAKEESGERRGCLLLLISI